MVAARIGLPEAGRQTVEIAEYSVLALTRQQDVDVFVEIDDRLLRVGKIRDRFGRQLEPYFGQGAQEGSNARSSDLELDSAVVDKVNEIIGESE